MQVAAADFETAVQAVRNMKVGWNLGNTLDANNGGIAVNSGNSLTSHSRKPTGGSQLPVQNLCKC